MKKLAVFAVLAAIVASCADDNPPRVVDNDGLDSPLRLLSGKGRHLLP